MSDSHGGQQELFSFEELGKAFARALEGQDAHVPADGADELVDIPEALFAEDADALAEGEPPEDDLQAEEDGAPGGNADAVFGDAVEDDGLVPVSPQTVLEAMLFMGDPENRPLTPLVAAELMRGVMPEEVHSLVRELNVKYDAQRTPWTVVMRDGGYVMQLREEFLPVRELFYRKVKPAQLSQQAIDILAIVAYKQPLTAEEVTEIRGTASTKILSQLVGRQLLRTKKTVRDGKPVTEYATTPRFLELFALQTLGDLPQSEDLDRK